MNEASKPVWFILFVVVGLATIVVISRSRSGGGDGHGAVPWQTDLLAAREEGARSGKPVLLYFTASWCPPCQKMKSSTWMDSAVADVIKARYIPVMIDVDEQKSVAAAYGVQGIPRVEVLSANGDRKLITEGYLSPQDMAAVLR
ncbi:thioredoxin family protein [Humisphaera borealis]|uniref:Thioredoxin family protein n=1 Tax=Humisphaera borealis TaxID=2807512 RepID=A0A7M2WQ83_9BACT|nr:thioredoxin family protein [Humisphaera borealis]QOV87687.1 thioredoxin family protein [Humisphaera borealis]